MADYNIPRQPSEDSPNPSSELWTVQFDTLPEPNGMTARDMTAFAARSIRQIIAPSYRPDIAWLTDIEGGQGVDEASLALKCQQQRRLLRHIYIEDQCTGVINRFDDYEIQGKAANHTIGNPTIYDISLQRKLSLHDYAHYSLQTLLHLRHLVSEGESPGQFASLVYKKKNLVISRGGGMPDIVLPSCPASLLPLLRGLTSGYPEHGVPPLLPGAAQAIIEQVLIPGVVQLAANYGIALPGVEAAAK